MARAEGKTMFRLSLEDIEAVRGYIAVEADGTRGKKL
jgi:hypothetical protein